MTTSNPMTHPTAHLKREDFKAIKHMDKEKMSAYLQRIYMRRFEAGLKASTVQRKNTKDSLLAPDTPKA